MILAIVVAGLAVLFIGGQTQRVDTFEPHEAVPLKLTNAMIVVLSPFANGIVQDTSTLHWNRPETVCPMMNLFVFDPSYDSVSIQGVTITLNRTNVFHLSDVEMSDPEYGLKLKFKPYDDPVAFREANPMYSKTDPRYVFYEPSPENLKLKSPPAVGTKVAVRVDFSIMAKEQSVCTTNVQAEFVLERHENRVSWASMLLWKLIMPKF